MKRLRCVRARSAQPDLEGCALMRRAFRLRLASCAATWLVGWGTTWAQAPAAPTSPSLNQPGRIAGVSLTAAELAALPPDQGVPPHVPQGQRCEESPDQLDAEAYLKRLQVTPAVDLNVFDVLLMQRAMPLMAERLRAGANPNVCGGQSNISLLAQAALFGSTAMVQLLLDHGAQLEWPADANGRTPLFTALSFSQYDVVELLLARGARLDVATYGSQTALHQLASSFAASAQYRPERDVKLAEHMLYSGIPINAKDSLPRSSKTPLMLAVIYDKPQLARFLIARGADLDMQDAKGQTAADLARKLKRTDMLPMLTR